MANDQCDTLKAILEGRIKTIRQALEPQPVLEADGMWHWWDCQWTDGALGFPESGIEDHAPVRVGENIRFWTQEDIPVDFKVTEVRVERNQAIPKEWVWSVTVDSEPI